MIPKPRFLIPILILTASTAGSSSATPLPGLSKPEASAAAAPQAGPLDQARAAAAKGDLAAAAEILKAAGEKGDTQAAIGYGEMLLTGQGIKVDPQEALRWFEKAAAAGDALGQFRQAMIFLNGATPIPADPDRGSFLLNAAAEAGQPDALNFLAARAEAAAQSADIAADRERHFVEARQYYIKAAELKNSAAMLALSRFLEAGVGGAPPDEKAAFDMAYLSCQAGNPMAMNEMGARYQQGRGVRADNVAALGWFLTSAESGFAPAMVNLGTAYETGNGVPQNYPAAGSWYARSAKSGFAPGQFRLAQMLEKGLGTDPDPLSAWINFSRAAAGGFAEAGPARDSVMKKLSREQIESARKEFPDLLLTPPKAKE